LPGKVKTTLPVVGIATRFVNTIVMETDAPATVLEGVTVGNEPPKAPGTIENPDGIELYWLEP